MKLLSAITAIFTAIVSFSQITLTESDFGNSGDTVRISVATDLMIDFSSTGANYNWDFSQLTPNSQYLKQYLPIVQAGFGAFLFGPMASPQYQASYFTESNTLPLDQLSQFIPINGFYTVSKVAPDAVTTVGAMIGVEDNLIPVKSDTIEIRYALPLTFGDSYNSVGYINLDMQPFYNGAWIQHRNHSSVVDGFGQITTPYGTFNTIRVRHEIEEYDSLLVDFNGTSFWVPIPVPLTREYEWWTNGEKEPILKIVTTDVFGNEVVSAIEYRDIYRGLDAGIEENEANISIGPNPTEGSFVVRSDQAIDKIRVIQADGRLVQEILDMKSSEITVDLDHLSSGHFFVEIYISGRMTSLPLVLR